MSDMQPPDPPEFYPDLYDDCDACEGTGEEAMPGDIRKCRACDGIGIIPGFKEVTEQ